MNSKTLLALVLSLSFTQAYAMNDEQVLNSDPINVDGYLREKNVTDQELEQIRAELRKQKIEADLNQEKAKGFKELSKSTEQLSNVTESYIDQKKNSQKEIADYNEKIKCLMEENPGKDCDRFLKKNEVVQEVSSGAAAPVVSTAEVSRPMGALRPFEEIKLSLNGGVTTFGKTETLRADTIGIRAESNITDRFSVNVGFGYTSFETEDFANNVYGNQGYSTPYYNTYGSKGRDIEFKNFTLDVGGKFFVARTERFRPYVGLNLGYNMADMRYMKNSSFNAAPYGYNYQFGNEELKSNFANATISLGTEIFFTRKIGMIVQGAYSKGLGSALSSKASQSSNTNPDQRRLGQLSDEVIDSNSLSILAGLMVIF